MKKWLIPFFVLIFSGLLIGQDDQTDETMENADMSDGTTHWHGDCQVAGTDSTNDFITNSGGSAKGIVVNLHAMSWTKVTQEIHEYKGHKGWKQLTIVYQATPDLKFSTRSADYGNLGPIIGFGGMNLPAIMGQATALIDMPPGSRASFSTSATQNIITIYQDRVVSSSFAPKADGQTQTFTAQWNPPAATQDDNPTFVLAFPPGNGTITLLKISLLPGQGMYNPSTQMPRPYSPNMPYRPNQP